LEGAPQGLLDLDLELVLVPNKIEDLSSNEIEGPQKRNVDSPITETLNVV
jgi:hypothetical protein